MSLRSETTLDETSIQASDAGSSGGMTLDVVTATDGAIAIDNGAWVTGADFDRQGFDLVIEGDDGQGILVRDYFAQAEPADLSLSGGEAVLRGAIVERLAGPAADGQFAQTGANDGGVIGSVQNVTGDGWATRVDGTRVALEEGSDIYLGDVLETSSEGSLAVNFVDGTSFSLAEDARMVIDELVYDPASSSNVASFSLVQGLFVMVSGDVSKTGEMTIETPVSTIGIRGTSVAIQAATEGLQNLITLLQDPDGTIGVVEVATAVAQVILNTLGATTSVTTANQAPSAVEILQGVDIEALYSTALATMQTTRDSALGLGSSVTGDDVDPTDSGDPAEEGESAPASEEDLSEFIEAISNLFAALADAVDDGDAKVDEEDVVDEDEVDELTESVVVEEPHSRKVLRTRDEPKETEETTAQTDVTTVEVTTADNNDVYLRGAFSELGIADNGTMGTTSTMPANFAANTHTPRDSVSFYANASGIDDGTPVAGDIFLPGAPVESMSLGFTDGTGFFKDANQNAGQENSLNMSFDSTTTNAAGTSVVNTGGIAGRMGISQTVTLGGDDTFYTTTVTLTNISGGAMTGVRYMRNNDPDPETDLGSGPVTINDVLLNPNSPGIAAVNAQGDTFGQNLLLLADQTAINDDNGFAQDTVEVRASAFGFENLDPYVASAFDTPADPNGASGDIGINMTFVVANLAAGAAVTFSWVTSINAASIGNDVMAALVGQTNLDGDAGDDIIYASQATKSETLGGSDGDDTLVAYSTGITSGDVLLGGDGMDRMIDGDGVDTFTGGGGADSFVFDDSDALYQIAGNTAFDPSALPKVDEITDLTSGTDTLEFVASAFGNLAIGALTNGVNFSVIYGGFDGTNAGVNLNHSLGLSSFVYSKSDGVLFYDDNGSGAGYQAVADVGQPGASDIEIVAAA